MAIASQAQLASDIELIDAYRKAAHDYDAAKAGTGNRVKAFTSFLVAERVLMSRLGTAAAAVGAQSSLANGHGGLNGLQPMKHVRRMLRRFMRMLGKNLWRPSNAHT